MNRDLVPHQIRLGLNKLNRYVSETAIYICNMLVGIFVGTIPTLKI